MNAIAMRFAMRGMLAALASWALLESWRIADAIHAQHDGGWRAAATAGAIMLSALVSSIAGFAFSAIAGTALAYLEIERVRAVQIIVLCSIVTQLTAVWHIRAAIRWRPLVPMIVAGALAVPLGVWLLLHVDGLAYAAGLGAFLAAYGCYIALRRQAARIRARTWVDAAAGALGGLTGGLAGIPGAPVTIWCAMQGLDKLQQRAVYQPYILAMQLVAIACLQCQALGHAGMRDNLALMPFAVFGAMGGLAIFRLVSNRQFQVALSTLLVISGLGLLGRAF